MSTTFPGYDGIDLSFAELESVVRDRREDWSKALARVKGVYQITDTHTGERYVGCAFTEHGVWGRWCRYIETGHGGNVALRSLGAELNFDYCRRMLRFSLLEHRSMRTSDQTIIEREAHWKRVLLGPMRRSSPNQN